MSGGRSQGVLPNQTTAGNFRSKSTANISAVVIDLKAIDDMLLNSSAPASPVARPEGLGPNLLEPTSKTSPRQIFPRANPNAWQMALAGAASGQRESIEAIEDDVRYFARQADEALRSHRMAAARLFHRMALDRMTPEMHARVTARREEIRQASIDVQLSKKTGTGANVNQDEVPSNATDKPKARF